MLATSANVKEHYHITADTNRNGSLVKLSFNKVAGAASFKGCSMEACMSLHVCTSMSVTFTGI